MERDKYKGSPSLLHRLGPGILVAATGVGAGDLVQASLAGANIGLTVLWAVWVGSLLKWLLNEGLARWQLATDTTLLEGWKREIGPWVGWVFMIYLFLWTPAVGGAIVKACGVAAAALAGTSESSVLWWGIAHSLAGICLVWVGRFSLFEKVMSAFIGLMFFTVVGSALKVGSFTDPALWKGLLIPSIPTGGLGWTLGVMGGVGGTVTVLSYGYWIAEEKRRGPEGLRACWLDLGVGYAMTAAFGLSMVVIGANLGSTEGKGVAMAVSDLLTRQVSPALGWLFLLGFWAAVASSLLGVWQGVPYLFADFWRLMRGREDSSVPMDRRPSYRIFLLFLGLTPLLIQQLSLSQIALIYAVLGSLFMPFLAATLLYLNGWKLRGKPLANPWWVNLGLVATLVFFAWQGVQEFFSG